MVDVGELLIAGGSSALTMIGGAYMGPPTHCPVNHLGSHDPVGGAYVSSVLTAHVQLTI